MSIKLDRQTQQNPVAAEVDALIAICRPVLMGLLQTIKKEKISDFGGYDSIKLRQLASAYVGGDGDTGICFEYAVHDAIRTGRPSVLERIHDALKRCKINNPEVASLLFGAEKSGRISLIDSVQENLTDDSTLMVGSRGRPVKLRRHINSAMAAFRSQKNRLLLPDSISGLWKADLFVGDINDDKWVGTTVKINQSQLEGAKGLRLAIVPSRQGKSDRIAIDDTKNLIVTPVPYDLDFMELFLVTVQTVKFVFARDARMPNSSDVPTSSARNLAKALVDRRDEKVADIIDSFEIIAQPNLMSRETSNVSTDIYRDAGSNDVDGFLGPVPILGDQ